MASKRDAASNQLYNYKLEKTTSNIALTSWGAPKFQRTATLTVGPHGIVALQDNEFLDDMAHFDRERIPERVVHAKGAGAFGYFEVTHDITNYTAATVFSAVGKRTPIAVRFSLVAGESGSADTVRDIRGFAIKFYTENGTWDLVGNNTPVFYIRDPILFPQLIHSQKRNPVTNLRDNDAFWDFISLRPETVHQIMLLFSDRGISDGYRHMDGYGCHAFKLVNKNGTAVYCKFHYKTQQGVRNLDPQTAKQIAAKDPDYSIRDLYNAIADGNFPVWKFFIQVMTFDQAQTVPFNPFDVTKTWPLNDFPLIPVGKFVLNRNPSNYFAEVEQIAFSPSNFIPGIEPSPDKILHGRLFSYGDTHRHRLGANFQQIPVNRPYRSFVSTNYQRDGFNAIQNQGGAPNYYPNSFNGPQANDALRHLQPPFAMSGYVARVDTGDEDNFSQPRIFYQKVLDAPSRTRLIYNIADNLKDAIDFIQKRVVHVFSQVDTDLGNRLAQALRDRNSNP